MYNTKRREFIKSVGIAGASIGLSGNVLSAVANAIPYSQNRIGIIGLDTSHSIDFTKMLNNSTADPDFKGYKIVAAYPYGSREIESSAKRIPDYIRQVKEFGVEIVESINDLLAKVDFVLLNTNDGRLHLEQALQVFKAGKRMYIDKPFAGSLADAIAIFEASAKFSSPTFTTSSMRYIHNLSDLRPEKLGKILGAETYSPAALDKTHPDLFWYGMHGVEMLYTVMGTGCKQVSRVTTKDTDLVTGVWNDNRVGSFRGTRTGPHKYGGTVFGEKAIVPLESAKGTKALMNEIIKFFQTGNPPVPANETIELYAFMEAADESKRRGGAVVNIDLTINKARKKAQKYNF